jgi:hypothetical protein
MPCPRRLVFVCEGGDIVVGHVYTTSVRGRGDEGGGGPSVSRRFVCTVLEDGTSYR